MTDKSIHLIEWDGEDPEWVAEVNHVDLGVLLSITELGNERLEFEDPEAVATVQVPILFPSGRVKEYPSVIPGLPISKLHPDRVYRAADFGFSFKRDIAATDPEGDIWSDERHDAELESESRFVEQLAMIKNIVCRLILLNGNVFLANERLSERTQEERLFLLVEEAVNKKRLELVRLKKRVQWQRKALDLVKSSRRSERREIPDELVKFILERDEVCRSCGSDVDLQLDHIIPVSRGGNDSEENLRLLCGTCNRRRGALTL